MRNDFSLTQSLQNEAAFEEVSANLDGQFVSNEKQEFISPDGKDGISRTTGIRSMEDLVQKIRVSSPMPFSYSLDFGSLLGSPKGGLNSSYINGESP